MEKVTQEEINALADKVDSEGFGYYMMHYGPDLDLLERMGFPKKEVETAINLFNRIQDAIDSNVD